LKKFVVSKHVNPSFAKEESYSDKEFEEIKKELKEFVSKCIIR